MTTNEDTLVRRGKKTPTSGLLQQTIVTLGHAEKHREVLGRCGFTRDSHEGLEATFAELQELMASRTLVECDASNAHRHEQEARAAAKLFVRTLRLAVPLLLRRHAITPAHAKAFAPARRLGRSTTRMTDHLAGLGGLVESHDEQLRPYFRGEMPSLVLESVRTALAAMNGAQEVRRGFAPLETRKLNLVKGRLLEQIADLNRIGQIAFINEPHLARQFDLSILARARRARRRGGAAEEEAAVVAAEGSPEPAPVEGEAGEAAARLRLIRLPRSASAGSATRWRLSGGKGIAADAVREAPAASGSVA